MYLMDVKEVMELVTLSRTTIYRKVKAGEFPAPKRLGSRTMRWKREDVLTWLESL